MRNALKIFFLLACFTTFGADIVLEHADRVVTDVSGQQMRTRLYGSIRIFHDGRRISAGYADWERTEGRMKFIGNVRLADSIQIITTDTLLYLRDTKMAHGTGNVVYSRIDSTMIVTGARGKYDGMAETLEMSGEPHLTSIDTIDGSRIELDAVELLYDLRVKMGIATDSVRVRIEPSDTADAPIFIVCDSMVFYPERDEVYAFGNVQITQREMHISCSQASYYRGAGRMKLAGSPIVTEGTNRISGNEMTIELKRGQIQRVVVDGSPERGEDPIGFWRPPDDTLNEIPESRFTAKQIIFQFEEGKVKRAHLIRQAFVDYFPMPEDPLRRESNTTNGDSIAVWFRDDEFDSIEVHRGARGHYVTQNLRDDSLRSVRSTDTLYYTGDYLALSRTNETVAVRGNAELNYGSMSLSAGDVLYDFPKRLLTANPIADGDSLIGLPVLTDAGESMVGRRIIYNVDTGRGRMVSASSELDLGYFRGGIVHKAQGDTLFVANSKFIPCECESSITHFWSDRLKLIPKEKAIARNIVLYLGDLPVFAVPFFVFPVQSGRRSGLTTFDIGQFQKGERFIRNVGYYWAPSEYWDVRAGIDYDERKGIVLRNSAQWVLRYKLRGNISTTYEILRNREFLETTGSDRWSISGSHQQNLWPRGAITARASYVSDKDYLADIELDPQERMRRNMSSSAAFTQDFDWGNVSMSLERNENLQTGRVTSSLPKIRVNRYTRPVFPAENEYQSKFYNKLSLAINAYSVYYIAADTLSSTGRWGLQSDPSLSLPISLGPYLTLNPRASGRFVVIDEGVDSMAFPMRFTYNFGTDANTNIYGRIPLSGFLGMKTLKHDISPRAGLTWSPEFESAENFYSFGGISAGGGAKALRANYTLTQDFGLTLSPDSLGSEREIRLGSVSTTTSQDFLAEGRSMADIRTSIRTSPARWLSMTAGFSHSLYPEIGDEISTFRLLSREITTNFSWRGSLSFGDSLAPVRRDYRVGLSHYIADRIMGENVMLTHWIKGELDIFITANWRLRYSHYFDIEKGEKVSDEFRIWRDMGCWEGIFVWVPSGFRQGWHFRVNIKKLPDIKVEGTRGNVR
ncbi:MAG TPA: LPS-assembly protein LptD [candidate division Zixibacteria bacterium]|nr:LPS-assembly protein LptD [candidate division Zixibacteria bacterium]